MRSWCRLGGFCALPVRVVLEDVVGDELQGVLWAGVAHLVQGAHDSRHYGGIKVRLGGEGVHIYLSVVRHRRKFGPETL